MGAQSSCEVCAQQSKCSYWTTDYDKLLKAAEIGDIIEIRRPQGYTHNCIYLGGKDVAHMTLLGNVLTNIIDHGMKPVSTIYRHKLKRVAKGMKSRIRNRDLTAARREGYVKYTPEQICQRALADVGRTYEYDAFELNCQEWATRMRYGVGFSVQVEHLLNPGQECDVCNYAAPFEQK